LFRNFVPEKKGKPKTKKKKKKKEVHLNNSNIAIYYADNSIKKGNLTQD
jgi:hypothetical protein